MVRHAMPAPSGLPSAPSAERVRVLLAGHRPADGSEADSLRKILVLLESSPAPFSRAHFAPGHLTASAVVCDAGRARTLLVFHAKLRRWLQPGGHFEPGEDDPCAAAAREVREETGLAARPSGPAALLDVDVHRIPARKSDPAHGHYDLRVLLTGAGQARAGDGVLEVRWFTWAECAALDLDPGLSRALRKAFGET